MGVAAVRPSDFGARVGRRRRRAETSDGGSGVGAPLPPAPTPSQRGDWAEAVRLGLAVVRGGSAGERDDGGSEGATDVPPPRRVAARRCGATVRRSDVNGHIKRPPAGAAGVRRAKRQNNLPPLFLSAATRRTALPPPQRRPALQIHPLPPGASSVLTSCEGTSSKSPARPVRRQCAPPLIPNGCSSLVRHPPADGPHRVAVGPCGCGAIASVCTCLRSTFCFVRAVRWPRRR